MSQSVSSSTQSAGRYAMKIDLFVPVIEIRATLGSALLEMLVE